MAKSSYGSVPSYRTRNIWLRPLCRARFKFSGHQKIHISKKWGFAKVNKDEFEDMVAEKQLIHDGCDLKYIPNHGPLDKW